MGLSKKATRTMSNDLDIPTSFCDKSCTTVKKLVTGLAVTAGLAAVALYFGGFFGPQSGTWAAADWKHNKMEKICAKVPKWDYPTTPEYAEANGKCKKATDAWHAEVDRNSKRVDAMVAKDVAAGIITLRRKLTARLDRLSSS